MTIEQELSFDPKSFLAKVGEGRSIGSYAKDRVVFTQGDPADSVFYIQKGKVKVTVVSEQGKEKLSSQSWGRMSSAAKGVWPVNLGAWRQLGQ